MPIPAIRVDDSACAVDDLAPCGGVTVTAAGEQDWEELVHRAVRSGWPGLEALPLTASTVAEAVRHNISAYGRSVDEVVASVRTWDLRSDGQRTFAWADCGFGPGTSRFDEVREQRQRYQILEVTFLFKMGDLSDPIADADLARALGVEPGKRVPLGAVRAASV